jgi:adenylate cyclase
MNEDLKDAYLEVEIGDLIRQFQLSSTQVCRVGRNNDNTIVLDDDSVSRNHVLLQGLPAGTFLIFDLGSRNGTLLNGQRLLAPTVLRDGDRISIGKIEIAFHQPGQGGVRDSGHATRESTNVNFDRKLITVLVVDVRDSTALARQLDSEKLSQVAGTCFREAGKALHECGAWTQKYMGDGVMAVWLHKEDGSELGREALSVMKALLRIVDIVSGLQSRFDLNAPIRIGGGLNSGWASIGNVGSAAASDYTAMGDVVNKAFRLESATKETGYDLLVSTETLSFLKSGPLGNLFQECPVKLKGYDQPAMAWGASFAELANSQVSVNLSIAPRGF